MLDVAGAVDAIHQLGSAPERLLDRRARRANFRKFPFSAPVGLTRTVASLSSPFLSPNRSAFDVVSRHRSDRFFFYFLFPVVWYGKTTPPFVKIIGGAIDRRPEKRP